jgi:hypothetical protein
VWPWEVIAKKITDSMAIDSILEKILLKSETAQIRITMNKTSEREV